MIPALITDRQAQLDALCRRHHVRRLELFGSAATSAWDAERSDLDFLVKFDDAARLVTRVDLEAALRQLFDRDIDLIYDTEFQNPYFRRSVEASRTHLWGEPRPAAPPNGAPVTTDRALKYLWEVRQEAEYLRSFAATSTFDEMLDSEHYIRSVPQSLTRIAESLNNLSKQDEATVERITGYKGYIGQRNILVHQYLNTDWEEVWHTVTEEIPVLIAEVTALLAELDPQGSEPPS